MRAARLGNRPLGLTRARFMPTTSVAAGRYTCARHGTPQRREPVTKHSVEAIVDALNSAGVRYLIAGGLAVVAHGHVRFTADVDLILDFAPDNVTRAIVALEGIGYRPRVPVAFRDFAYEHLRRQWVREKNMTVFSLYSDAHPATEIDLFVEAPLDFDAAYKAAARMEVAPETEAMFVGYFDLLRMKERAGRPVDVDDIRQLKAIREDTE